MRYVDADGQPTEDAPSYLQALVSLDKAERRLAGADMRVAMLEAERDREYKALTDPLRPEIDALHAVWKEACKRERDLEAEDVEKAARRLRKRGFLFCLTCIMGAHYDPGTRERRNGTTERYDDWELIFRTDAKALGFAERAPRGWQPDPERIAVIGGVEVAWVRDKLGIKDKENA